MGPCVRRDNTEFFSQKRRSGSSAPALSFYDLRSLRRVEAGDRLDLEIFLKAELAPFAAVARLLVAAERRGAVVRHALQVDVAGADAAADATRAFHRIAGDVT